MNRVYIKSGKHISYLLLASIPEDVDSAERGLIDIEKCMAFVKKKYINIKSNLNVYYVQKLLVLQNLSFIA